MADHETHVDRPTKVVMVDADDPLREIHGEFVWLDDHERAIAATARAAYAEGLEAGRAQSQQVQVTMQRRLSWTAKAQLVAAGLLVLFVLLMLPVLLTR